MSRYIAYVCWALPWFRLKSGTSIGGYMQTYPRLLKAFWHNRPRTGS